MELMEDEPSELSNLSNLIDCLAFTISGPTDENDVVPPKYHSFVSLHLSVLVNQQPT